MVSTVPSMHHPDQSTSVAHVITAVASSERVSTDQEQRTLKTVPVTPTDSWIEMTQTLPAEPIPLSGDQARSRLQVRLL